MASPLPDPYHPTPPLFLSRSNSTSTRKGSGKLSGMLTATRAPSPLSRSRTNLHATGSPLPKAAAHPYSAPPTWRSKFADAFPTSSNTGSPKTLRRSNLKISSPIPLSGPVPSKRRLSSTSTTSTIYTSPANSTISLASSTVSYGEAEPLEIFRPSEKPKVVDVRAPLTTHPQRKDSAQDRKLRRYFGVQQGDREMVARQRAGSAGAAARMSAFREEFSAPVQVQMRGHGRDPADAESMTPAQDRGSMSEELSDGLVKWFRCDIYPADAPAFHTAEAEAKRLVELGGGRVMGQWTYPGGFMFQIPRNLACPLPAQMPTATQDPIAKLLLAHLGPEGHVRTTEFQPYLDPLQHIVSLSPYVPGTPTSGASTIRPNSAAEDRDGGNDMMSAMEYITTTSPARKASSPVPAAVPVEEIPLLRTSPVKPMTTNAAGSPRPPRQSWQSGMYASPESKGKLHHWLQRQQGAAQAKRKRDGQVYDLSQSARLQRAAILRKIVEEEEGDDDEWASEEGSLSEDDGASREGSEFSIATGLDSVKFVAECGSLF